MYILFIYKYIYFIIPSLQKIFYIYEYDKQTLKVSTTADLIAQNNFCHKTLDGEPLLIL